MDQTYERQILRALRRRGAERLAGTAWRHVCIETKENVRQVQDTSLPSAIWSLTAVQEHYSPDSHCSVDCATLMAEAEARSWVSDNGAISIDALCSLAGTAKLKTESAELLRLKPEKIVKMLLKDNVFVLPYDGDAKNNMPIKNDGKSLTYGVVLGAVFLIDTDVGTKQNSTELRSVGKLDTASFLEQSVAHSQTRPPVKVGKLGDRQVAFVSMQQGDSKSSNRTSKTVGKLNVNSIFKQEQAAELNSGRSHLSENKDVNNDIGKSLIEDSLDANRTTMVATLVESVDTVEVDNEDNHCEQNTQQMESIDESAAGPNAQSQLEKLRALKALRKAEEVSCQSEEPEIVPTGQQIEETQIVPVQPSSVGKLDASRLNALMEKVAESPQTTSEHSPATVGKLDSSMLILQEHSDANEAAISARPAVGRLNMTAFDFATQTTVEHSSPQVSVKKLDSNKIHDMFQTPPNVSSRSSGPIVGKLDKSRFMQTETTGVIRESVSVGKLTQTAEERKAQHEAREAIANIEHDHRKLLASEMSLKDVGIAIPEELITKIETKVAELDAAKRALKILLEQQQQRIQSEKAPLSRETSVQHPQQVEITTLKAPTPPECDSDLKQTPDDLCVDVREVVPGTDAGENSETHNLNENVGELIATSSSPTNLSSDSKPKVGKLNVSSIFSQQHVTEPVQPSTRPVGKLDTSRFVAKPVEDSTTKEVVKVGKLKPKFKEVLPPATPDFVPSSKRPNRSTIAKASVSKEEETMEDETILVDLAPYNGELLENEGQGMYLVVLTKNTQNLVIARYDDFFDSNQQLVNGQLKTSVCNRILCCEGV